MEHLPSEQQKYQILTKREATPVAEYGKYPEKRSIAELLTYGLVNIDKPAGPTSHQVSAYVQQILHIDKSGHSGTLDPNVTGSLVIALGKATRVVQTLLPAGKEYVCVMHLHADIPEYEIYKVCQQFLGDIEQLPPVKSAVKRQWRTRTIYYLEIIEVDGRDVLFKAGCEAGTYIRKLVHDIGLKLGCGAHMSELRRTKVGPFSVETSVTLQELTDAYHYFTQGNETFLRKIILPMEQGVEHLPRIWVLDSTIHALSHGTNLYVPGFSKLTSHIEKGEMVAILSLKGELVALGTALMDAQEIMTKEKGVCVKVDKVFIDPEVYPKLLH